jgi:hypothetical protein
LRHCIFWYFWALKEKDHDCSASNRADASTRSS